MAYIGNSPANIGNYQVVDDISSTFNGVLTSFALTASSLAINPAKSGQLLVSINGVLQEPDDTGTEGFKVSGSNIVFSSAPATGSTFWAVWQGQAVDIGTPSDGVVGTAQMSSAELALTGGLSLGDNVKATFGAGDDLQIYHDGASGQSFISESGGGSFLISGTDVYIRTPAGENSIFCDTDGTVTLYHDNSPKLATTATGVDVTGNVACDSLGVTGSTGSIALGGSGNNIDIGSGTGTQSAILNLGAGRTASGYAYIDLTGDTTYTDYGLRVMRENTGANANSQISHRGTGQLALAATDGGNLIFNSAGEKMRIDSAGNVGIGLTNPSANLHVYGTIKAGNNPQSTGEFNFGVSSASIANGDNKHLATFQSSNNNGLDGGILIHSFQPRLTLNDTSGSSSWTDIRQDGSRLVFGSGSNADLFSRTSDNLMTLTSDGKLGIGTASPSYDLDISKSVDSGSVVARVINTSSTGVTQGIVQIGAATSYVNLSVNGSGDYISLSGSNVDTIYSSFDTHIFRSSASAERMRITSAGNVGIGTTSPSAKLHVDYSVATDYTSSMPWSTFNNDGLVVKNSDIGSSNNYSSLAFYTGGSGGNHSSRIVDVATSSGNGYLSFQMRASADTINTVEKLRINSNGNVGIGTTNPVVGLEVASSVIKSNGKRTYSFGGYMLDAATYNYDITVKNDGGTGNTFFVTAGYAHTASTAYSCALVASYASRATAIASIGTLTNQTSTNAGSWTVSKPNSTTLRVTKNAGTYAGSGYGHVTVVFNT